MRHNGHPRAFTPLQRAAAATLALVVLAAGQSGAAQDAAPETVAALGLPGQGGGPALIGQPYPALELELLPAPDRPTSGPRRASAARTAAAPLALDGSLLNAARVAGRPFVIDFFATWCEPCHRALADLLAARASLSGPPPLLVLVDLGEPPELVRQWTARAGLPADALVAVDPQGTAAHRWGARRLPTTFLVDGSGLVRHINRGWGAGYRARLTRWLRDLTAAPAPLPSPPPIVPAR